jgi:hypothetical protein
MGAAQMGQRSRPVAARVENGGDDAVGIGVAVGLGERQRGERIGQVGPAEREKPARSLIEDVRGTGGGRERGPVF